MNKKLMAWLASALLSCAVMTGCGGASSNAKAAFVGQWSLSGMTQEGTAVSADDLAKLKDVGMEATITLAEDGKATLNSFGNVVEGTWEASSAEKGSFKAQDQSYELTLSGSTLTMSSAADPGTTVTFAKGAAEASSASATDSSATSADATASASASATDSSSAAA